MDFILRLLCLLRLIIRIRIFYFVNYVPFVVKFFFPFGCGSAALRPLWLNFFVPLVAAVPR